jgi:hypothetical protein
MIWKALFTFENFGTKQKIIKVFIKSMWFGIKIQLFWLCEWTRLIDTHLDISLFYLFVHLWHIYSVSCYSSTHWKLMYQYVIGLHTINQFLKIWLNAMPFIKYRMFLLDYHKLIKYWSLLSRKCHIVSLIEHLYLIKAIISDTFRIAWHWAKFIWVSYSSDIFVAKWSHYWWLSCAKKSFMI